MTSENDKPNPPPIRDAAHEITVPASRLAWGAWNHEKNRDEGTGDIHSSYSADTIATSGNIRRAFRHAANLMVTVSMSGRGGVESAEAYSLIPTKVFTGTPTTYAEKVSIEGGDMARNDPMGFYDRISVKHGGESFVMRGPPIVFVAEPERPGAQPTEPAQMELFAP